MLTQAQRLAVAPLAKQVAAYLTERQLPPDTASLSIADGRGGDLILTITEHADAVTEAHVLHMVAEVFPDFRLDRPHTPAPVPTPVSDEWLAAYQSRRPGLFSGPLIPLS